MRAAEQEHPLVAEALRWRAWATGERKDPPHNLLAFTSDVVDAVAELQAAQEREKALRQSIDRMLSEIGEPNADYAAPIAEAYWIGQEVLNGPQTQPAQRTEEPSDGN